MYLTESSEKSFRFDFWKDKFWIWVILSPLGVVCWAIPFFGLTGVFDFSSSPGWLPYFSFMLLGIPCYLIGWIFIYQVMEWVYTKVMINNERISVRLPWVIFPLIPVMKRLDRSRIEHVDLAVPYGTRTAVFLYYHDRKKYRYFYLPKFLHSSAYFQEIVKIKQEVDPEPVWNDQPAEVKPD